MELETKKYLDVSTCHITQRDNDILDRYAEKTADACDIAQNPVYNYGYGFYVPILYVNKNIFSTRMSNMKKDGFSQEFIDIYYYCVNNKIDLLNIDMDGQIHDNLPKFDW